MNAHSTGSQDGSADRPGRGGLPTVAVLIAVALQGVMLVPFTVGSGLLAPGWGVVVSYVLWLGAASALFVLARRRPLAAPLAPLANAALLFGFITFGDLVLGWTA